MQTRNGTVSVEIFGYPWIYGLGNNVFKLEWTNCHMHSS